MGTSRATMRQERRRGQVPSVAIAGYTNAGKSSLLNRLTGSDALVEDALFATLDPTVRQARANDGRVYTMTDTVGFVRHLPHQLVEAFRSTLEEVAEADLLLHVVDGAHEDPEGQLAAVREVLRDIDAAAVPEIVVVNKSDVADPMVLARLLRNEPHAVAVSARTGLGIAELRAAIERDLPRPRVEVSALVPYARGDLVARAHRDGVVLSAEHTSDGTLVHALVGQMLAAELAAFPATAASARAPGRATR